MEHYKNRKVFGRKKHDEAWMASYNDFVVKYESGMTIMEIVNQGEISRRTAYNNSVNKLTMGWSKDLGPTYLAGRLPAVFYFRGIMKELSVFVDESGDFGEYEKDAPFYFSNECFFKY